MKGKGCCCSNMVDLKEKLEDRKAAKDARKDLKLELKEEKKKEKEERKKEKELGKLQVYKKQQAKKEISSFYAVAYRLLIEKVAFLFPRLISLERKLLQGGMPVFYEAYICGLVLISVSVGAAGLIGGIVLAVFVKFDPPEIGVLFVILFTMAGFLGAFGMMYMYPAMNAKSRATKLMNELPYYIGYMSTLSASGLGIEGVFRAIAREDSKEAIVVDAQNFTRNLDMLGLDAISGLQDLIYRAPPGTYNEMLEGLVSTVQSGGSLKDYFIATAKVQMEEKQLMIKKMTASLGIVAELYTILLIVFPLLAVIMLSIMAIMTPNLGGMSLTMLMKGLTYGMVPLFGLIMLILIDSMVPKR